MRGMVDAMETFERLGSQDPGGVLSALDEVELAAVGKKLLMLGVSVVVGNVEMLEFLDELEKFGVTGIIGETCTDC